MKKLIFLFLLLASASIGRCQTTAEVGGLYKFISPMKLTQCDEDGEAVADTKAYSIPVNWQFTVQKVAQKGIIISIAKWHYPDDATIGNEQDITKKAKLNSNKALSEKYHGTPDKPIYFLIQTADLQSDAVRLQHGGTVSLVTGSSFLKFRPGSGTPVIGNSTTIGNIGKSYYKSTDIANDFTISVLGSLKLSPAGSSSDFFALFGVNFSSIKVTPATTQDFLTAETNVGSLAPTIGIMYQVDKVQFGILSGIDILTGDVNRYWVYRGRPWFAVGIGFSLVSALGTSTSDNSNK